MTSKGDDLVQSDVSNQDQVHGINLYIFCIYKHYISYWTWSLMFLASLTDEKWVICLPFLIQIDSFFLHSSFLILVSFLLDQLTHSSILNLQHHHSFGCKLLVLDPTSHFLWKHCCWRTCKLSSSTTVHEHCSCEGDIFHFYFLFASFFSHSSIVVICAFV